ncbi:aminoacyl-tRNA hydrolase [Agaribacterium haliotis]|uniref:aminoacyl-tRNA hydrolase n=1 Tax=Agaribacterium haliotis TaxID=2013869 RepID=UPI000BB57ECE|nr:aminoacyl-tRNA hydrolase [Agaribacterium haliotis]
MKSKAVPIRMIVGLGNPGSDYERTRHNAGQDLVELLARQVGSTLAPSPKFFGLCAKARIANSDVHLVVPTTYMNRSGQAVGALARFYKIAPEEILVVHDELDLSPGVARLKIGGGHGGHNGLRDIISALANNKNFARLRLGIGHPGQASQVASYVLKRAAAADQQAIDTAIDESLRVLDDVVSADWDKATRELHSRTK